MISSIKGNDVDAKVIAFSCVCVCVFVGLQPAVNDQKSLGICGYVEVAVNKVGVGVVVAVTK